MENLGATSLRLFCFDFLDKNCKEYPVPGYVINEEQIEDQFNDDDEMK